MRKIFVFILLICAINAQAKRYNDFAELLFARMSVQPSDDEKDWISEAFDTLQYRNLVQKLDYFKIYAANNITDAFLNWTNDIYNSTSLGAGTLVFAQDTGIKSDGNNVINSNFNPSTGIHYTLAKGCLGAYVRNEVAENLYCIGITTAPNYVAMKILSSDNTTRFSLNSASGTGQSYTNPGSSTRIGLFIVNKSGDGNVVLNINGNDVRTVANTDATIPNFNIYSCGCNNNGTATNFCAKQFSAEFAGYGLSLVEKQVLFRVIERFLDHKNVGVK